MSAPDKKDTIKKEPIAVIDIGSNAVRLVIYDALDRAPVRVHNERNICNLGRDLSLTGKLNPEGVAAAMDSLARFIGLIDAMKIRHVRAVATASMRDAADGKKFIETVHKKFGLEITVVQGEEEARLSALGVMMNGLGEGAVIGDYGGGSLELIAVRHNKVRHRASLPIGSHRLRAIKGREARLRAIDEALATVDFLKDCKGMDFCALGGAWRSMARAHMMFGDYPIPVLDHYRMGHDEAVGFSDLISRQSAASLEKAAGLSKKRVEDMGVAALALGRVLQLISAPALVFSGTGLREGLLFDALPPVMKRQSGLMASCRKIALSSGRGPDMKGYDALAKWLAPIFEGEGAAFLQLLEAAAFLSDISYQEHEDYQAKHAFGRLLVAPFYGVDHRARAYLALSQYVRYAGEAPAGNSAEDSRAVVTGLALRAGHLLTGGALSLLAHTSLKLTPKTLTLTLLGRAKALKAESVEAAFAELSAVLGRKCVILT